MNYEARQLSKFVERILPRNSSTMPHWPSVNIHHLDDKFHPATWSALIALALVAFLLRTPHLDAQSLWRDEVDVIRLANSPLSQLAQDITKAEHNGPFYYLLMRGWLKLAGAGEFALRFPSLCFGVLAVPLIYQAGQRLVGGKSALVAAILAAISPYLVWYSQDAKMYALVADLIMLAVICELKALVRGRIRCWAGFVFSASLSLYTHMLSALMIPVYMAVFLLGRPRHRGGWWKGLASLGLLTLPYAPLAIWQLPLVLNTHETGHPFYPIREILSLLFNLYSRGITMVGSWIVLAAFVFAMLGGAFSPARGNLGSRFTGKQLSIPGEIRPRLFLLLWLFLPIAVVYLVSLRVPVFEPRYLIFVAPAFYLLTASGLVALSRLSPTAAGLTLAVVLSSSLLGVWVQMTTPIKSDFRAAAAYVTAHRQGDVPIMFQMPYARHTFDYYFQSHYVALEGSWTNDGKTEAELDDEMVRLLADYAEVWFVVSESWLWDSRDLVRTWLDQHAQLVESASFTLVDVYHYDLSNIKSANTGTGRRCKCQQD